MSDLMKFREDDLDDDDFIQGMEEIHMRKDEIRWLTRNGSQFGDCRRHKKGKEWSNSNFSLLGMS